MSYCCPSLFFEHADSKCNRLYSASQSQKRRKGLPRQPSIQLRSTTLPAYPTQPAMRFHTSYTFDPRTCRWVPNRRLHRDEQGYPRLPTLPMRTYVSIAGRLSRLSNSSRRLAPRVLERRGKETRKEFTKRSESYEAKVFFNAREGLMATWFSSWERAKVYRAVKRKSDWSVFDELVKRRKVEDRVRFIEIRSGPEIRAH